MAQNTLHLLVGTSARRFVADRNGGLMPLFALMLFAVLAMIGAAISLSMDSRSANNLQHSADSSALGGAIAFLQSESPRVQDRVNQAKSQARIIAEQNANFQLTALDMGTVTEDAYGQHFSLEVELQFKPVNAAASLVGRNANVDIRRRAVASATWGFPLCILSLEKRRSGFALEDAASLDSGDCIIWSNAKGRESARLNGGELKTNHLCTHGRIRRLGRFSFFGKHAEKCDQLPDPMAEWEAPKADNCLPEAEFLPPPQYLKSGENAPEFDRNNREFYGGRENMLMTRLNTNNSPTTEYYWGGKLEKRYDEIDRVSKDDNCHQHTGAADFHCHKKSSQLGYVDHREYAVTRYVPDDSETDGFATLAEARDAGVTGLADFHDLTDVDNMDAWEYEDDNDFRMPTNVLKPGTYCGINIAWGHVKMDPGVYFIKGAPLEVTRKAKLTAEGVTLIFTEPGAYLRVSDQADFQITAPVEGETAGIAIAEDRATKDPAKGNMVSRLSGKGNASIVGLVYLPTHDFFLSGAGTGDQTSPLLQMIVNRLAMVENSEMNIDFQPGETSVPVIIQPERAARLVE